MKNKALKFKDFESEKIDKKTQKIIRGGDGETQPPVDPNKPEKSGGSGNG